MANVRCAVLAAGLLAVAVAVPAGGAAAPTSQTLVLVRTTPGPASYDLRVSGSLSAERPDGFQVQVAARVDPAGRVEDAASLGALTYHFDRQPAVRAQGTAVEVCGPAGGCIVNRTLEHSSATTSRDGGGPDAFNRLFVVVEGPAAISFKGDGWRLERKPLRYRYVRDQEARGSGAYTGGGSVMVFEEAELGGGPRGSIAAGQPPCSTAAGAGAPVPRGAGTLRLVGGSLPGELACPNNVGVPTVTRWAAGPTTWRATGPVVGDSAQSNVPLVVIDVP